MKKTSSILLLCSLQCTLAAVEYAQDCNEVVIPQQCIQYNPPAGPQLCDSYNVFTEIDGFYWFTKEDNLDYAIKDQNPFNASTTFNPLFPFGNSPSNNAKVINVQGSWDFGFRAKIGAFFCDKFDLQLIWTRFHTDVHSHVSTNSNQRLFTTWIYPNTDSDPAGSFVNSFGEAAAANAKWTMHEDLIDLEWGRDSWVGKCLSIRPYVGLRSCWLKQNLNLNYLNIPGITNLDIAGLAQISIHTKNNFWGIGPRGGLNSFWKFNDSWGIYGDISTSLIWGYFNVRMKEQDFPDALPVRADIARVFSAQKANLEFRVGIEWNHTFCERYRLLLALGWDEQIWFKQNQLFTVFSNESVIIKNGDLMFSGVTLSGRWDF